jgi:uncharacterized protein (DUF697 family)
MATATILIPEKLRKRVRDTMLAAGALGPLGAFSTAADVATIAGCWGTLLLAYCDHYDVRMDKDTAVKTCSSILLGLGSYYAGCKLATKLFHLIPFAGTLMGMGISSVANILFTYRFALTLTRCFDENYSSTSSMIANFAEMFKTYGALGSAEDAIRVLMNKEPLGRNVTGEMMAWAKDKFNDLIN